MMTNSKIPSKIINGADRAYTISALWEGTRAQRNTTSERDLLSLVLPAWQRPAVWTLQQQTLFLEGVFLGLGTGYYVINGRDYERDGRDKPMSGWLIDGQQRITAIARFISGEITVFDGVHYADLSVAEQRRRFDNLVFPCVELEYESNEDLLKNLYRRLNFSGTAHTQNDLNRLDQAAG